MSESGEVMQDATPCVLCGTYGSHNCKGAPSAATPAPRTKMCRYHGGRGATLGLPHECMACCPDDTPAPAVSAPDDVAALIARRSDTTIEAQSERWRCVKCGCVWRRWLSNRSWSLYDAAQRPCAICDNSPDFLSVVERYPTLTDVLTSLDDSADKWWCREAAAMLRRLSAPAGDLPESDFPRITELLAKYGHLSLGQLMERIEATELLAQQRGERIEGYQGSRDHAIELLSAALHVERDKVRAVEYYARLASERIAELEKDAARSLNQIDWAEVYAESAHWLAQVEALLRRTEPAEARIAAHNEDCRQACSARGTCNDYTARGRMCPDCPQDWMIDTALNPATDAAQLE